MPRGPVLMNLRATYGLSDGDSVEIHLYEALMIARSRTRLDCLRRCRVAIAHSGQMYAYRTREPMLFWGEIAGEMLLVGGTGALLRQLTAAPSSSQWTLYYVLRRPVSDAEPPALIGVAGYVTPPTRDGVVEIGYAIAAEHQRRGYATQAVAALLARAFADSGVRVVGSLPPGASTSHCRRGALETTFLRLRRGTSERRHDLATARMDQWAAYLRGQADALDLSVVETTSLTVAEAASQLEAIVWRLATAGAPAA